MLQALPLEVKIRKSKQRIQEWVDEFGEDGVYISFSGGKDSTVLLDIVRDVFPNIEAVFIDTGLEYPEIRQFVKEFNNVTTIRPKKNFRQVITEFGYPIISKEVSQVVTEARAKPGGAQWHKLHGEIDGKYIRSSMYDLSRYQYLESAPFLISHKCCIETKKKPAHAFHSQSGKVPIIGMLAEESVLRTSQWLKAGCNSFVGRSSSNPLSFWINNDVLTYIRLRSLPISSVYGEIIVDDSGQIPGQTNLNDCLCDYRECQFRTTGCDRTGCMFCLFGAHLEKGLGRFERMKETHPKQYDYVMRGGTFDSDGMWKPDGQGLGFKFVIDWLNEHGNLNIRY